MVEISRLACISLFVAALMVGGCAPGPGVEPPATNGENGFDSGSAYSDSESEPASATKDASLTPSDSGTKDASSMSSGDGDQYDKTSEDSGRRAADAG